MQRKIKGLPIFIFICMVMLVMTGCISSQEGGEIELPKVREDARADLPKGEKEEDTAANIESEPIITSATLAAVGDILIHSSIYKDAQVGDSYSFDQMFELVQPYLESADITFANQESMMGGSALGLSDYPQFNSPFEIGDTLKRVGVDIVSMANNHTLDRGEQAILNAIKHWNELGIEYTGAYKNEEDQERIRTIDRNGITFSFLAYTYGTNGIPIPEGKAYLVNLIDREQIAADITQAKAISDVVVVSLHFGIEYQRMPSQEQVQLVQFVADQGAHLILGHHPHVLQPVQYIEAQDGQRAFAIYSLGNFIAAQEELPRRIGGILRVEVEKVQTGDQVQININTPAFLPTYTYFKNWRNYSIIPMYQVTEGELKGVDQHYAEIKTHMSQFVPDLQFIEQVP